MNWRETTLGALCAEGGGNIQTGPFGSQLHASDYVIDGIPTVMPTNIGENIIRPDGIAQISKSDAERLNRYRLRPGDIIYSRRGDVEKRAYVQAENDGWLCGTGCLRARFGDASTCNSRFVSYLLGTEEARRWILQHAIGATMPNLNTSILSALPVRIPDIKIQYAIAEVLGALDDKIATNRFSAKTSRNLAATHFTRGHHAAHTASYATVTIENLIQKGDLVVGDGYRTKRAEHAETGFRIIRVTDVVEGTVAPTGTDRVAEEFSKAIGSKAGRPGDVLLTTKGTVGRVALTPDLDEQIVYSPQICYFRCSENPRIDRFYLRYWFESTEFRAQADHRMNNTDMAPYISLADIRSLQLTMPEAIKARALSEQLAALENTAQGLLRENVQLAEFRDTLLPHLMSGRLCVKDAEKHVEAVV